MEVIKKGARVGTSYMTLLDRSDDARQTLSNKYTYYYLNYTTFKDTFKQFGEFLLSTLTPPLSMKSEWTIRKVGYSDNITFWTLSAFSR